MKVNMNNLSERIMRGTVWTVSIAAIVQLALSQFTIRISRLSTAEQTGILLFAFMLLGLIAIFAVSRMKDSIGAKLFAVLVNFIAAFTAVRFLGLLFADEIFMRGLLYSVDPVTQVAEPLSSGRKAVASLPIVWVALGAIVYGISGLTIMIVGICGALKSGRKTSGE